MTSAGIYQLLAVDDTKQDSFLKANAYLTNKIIDIKKTNLEKLNKNLEMLQELVFTETFNLKRITNTDTYNKKVQYINDIKKQIKYLNDNKIDLCKPSEDDITKSHFLFIKYQYKPFVNFSFGYIKTIAKTQPTYGGVFEYEIKDYGEFISDMMLFIKLDKLLPNEPTDKVCYIDYIGHKIIKNVKFIVSNNVLDEYDSEFYNVYYETQVSNDKKKAWMQCMGQEIPFEAQLVRDNSDNFREIKYISNGYQTLKNEQPEVLLFIPLLFWFNIDSRLALPNNLPIGQMKIQIELEQSNKLMTCCDPINRLYNEKYSIPTLIDAILYTRHYYINKDIQDIFISKLGFNLIRIHKKIEKIVDKNNDTILINELKFPIESLFIYFRPNINENGIDNLDTWYKNSILNLQYIKTPIIYTNLNVDTLGSNNVKYYDELPIINTLELRVNDSSTFGNNYVNFYNSYLPLISNNSIITTNNNIYYFPFNLNANDFQPSGYINLSISREIYLHYSSDLIELYNPIKLYIHSIALNILLITPNSMCNKYLT